MKKYFVVFLVGVDGGSLWLLFQITGLDGIKENLDSLKPRSEQQAAASGSADTFPVSTPANTSRTTIRLASFNIQVFGRTKIDKPVVMATITRIVQQFDVVAIQEVRST